MQTAILVVVSICAVIMPRARADGGASVDPKARQVLDAMVRAYRDVSRIEQISSYGETSGLGDHIVQSRIVVQHPNRLVLDLSVQTSIREQPYLSRFQSDGKELFSYQEKQGWFTRDKAPKSLKELDFLAVGLEMTAITGGDPISPLLAGARSVRMDHPMEADGEPADVVVIDNGSTARSGEVRLIINQRDHLLRRFSFESTPVESAAQTDGSPDSPGEGPSAVRFSYDTHVKRAIEMTKDAFVWVAPAGSFQYQQYPGALGQSPGARADKRAGKAVTALPFGIQPMKIISLQDLMKNAAKPNQKRKK